MSHAVETFAYNRVEAPWHHLGVPVDSDLTPVEMCRAAGLDWQVELRPTYVRGLIRDENGALEPGFVEVPRRKALVRTSDARVFCTTGDRWKPLQNERAFDFFKAFCEAGHATMETAGALHHGKLVFGLARLGADFKLPGNDEVKGYLLLVSPHQAGQAIVARVTPVRVVCQNTLTMAMSRKAAFESRFSHAREFNPELAAATFGQAREQVRAFERSAHVLKQLNLGDDDVIRILAPIFQPVKKETDLPVEALVADKAKLNRPMQSLMSAYVDAPGADPGNGWGVLNSATYMLDHTYGRDKSQRLFHSWLAVGANQKRTLLKELLERAGHDYDEEDLGLVAAE